MADTSRNPDSADPLDAGLRAAFGGDTQPPTGAAHPGGALSILETRTGARTQVLLREAPDEQGPIVKPLARELLSTSFDGTRYQVMGEIARGGVGVIMKSRDVDLGRDVAMKVLRDDHIQNPSMIRRFVEEAQIAGQLQHPGILPVYELGVQGDQTPYFTMKLVRGDTFSAVLRARQDPTEDRVRVLEIFRQICQTLAYAHAKGVIHRDLKPSNVLVGTFGEVQVVDWGLAKVQPHGGLVDDQRDSDTDRGPEPADESVAIETVRSGGSSTADPSLAGSVLGTPAYMPPEQARGDVDRIDERADVFALGAILCEILTGHAPYKGSRHEVLEQARRGDLSHARALLEGDSVEDELRDLAVACLAPDAQDRPRTATAVADAVAAYLASLDARAKNAEIAAARADARAIEERRRRRVTGVLALVIVTLVLAIGGGAYALHQQRAADVAERSTQLHDAIDRAAALLATATSAPIGETEPWFAARTAAAEVEERLHPEAVDDTSQRRATEFLVRFTRADDDRRITEKIEEVVVMGGTHNDADSWQWMERELRATFQTYGIDLENDSNGEIERAIAASELAPQLVDGLELWIATIAHLGTFGVHLKTEQELRAKLDILYGADSDPVATQVRKLLYSMHPQKDAVLALVDDLDYAATPAAYDLVARELLFPDPGGGDRAAARDHAHGTEALPRRLHAELRLRVSPDDGR